MKKMPIKYAIIFAILSWPLLVVFLVSLLTPYNLIVIPLFLYSAVFSAWCAAGVGIYGTYFAPKSHKNGDIAK